MKKRYVLDTNAVLDFSDDRPGALRLERLFEDALEHNNPVLISVANWGEVFYTSWKARGEEFARKMLADLSRLPIEVVPLDLEQVLKAGELKVLHNLPYVDCIAAALATLSQATLVTSDRDFEKLGRRFPILWLARS